MAHTRQRARRARELERRRMRRAEQRAGTRGAAKPQDKVPRTTLHWCHTHMSHPQSAADHHKALSKMLPAPPRLCFKRIHSGTCCVLLVSSVL